MRIWRSLAYLSLATSLISLAIANASWLLNTRAALSPRAYAAGAAIALLYAITFLLIDMTQKQ